MIFGAIVHKLAVPLRFHRSIYYFHDFLSLVITLCNLLVKIMFTFAPYATTIFARMTVRYTRPALITLVPMTNAILFFLKAVFTIHTFILPHHPHKHNTLLGDNAH